MQLFGFRKTPDLALAPQQAAAFDAHGLRSSDGRLLEQPPVRTFCQISKTQEVYIRNFVRYALRSMLAPGNIPALAEQGRVVLVIVTDSAGERMMRADPIVGKAQEWADLEYIVVIDDIMSNLTDGHVVRNSYQLYGMLDHCSVYFAQAARAHL